MHFWGTFLFRSWRVAHLLKFCAAWMIHLHLIFVDEYDTDVRSTSRAYAEKLAQLTKRRENSKKKRLATSKKMSTQLPQIEKLVCACVSVYSIYILKYYGPVGGRSRWFFYKELDNLKDNEKRRHLRIKAFEKNIAQWQRETAYLRRCHLICMKDVRSSESR
jgi:hypothetical protein